MSDFIKATEAAYLAVKFDQTGQIDKAMECYRIAASLLDRSRDQVQPERQPELRDKVREYHERAATLQKRKDNAQEAESKLALQQSYSLLQKALAADEDGVKDLALKMYILAVESAITIKAGDPEMKTKMKNLARQALDRAEELKGIKRIGSMSLHESRMPHSSKHCSSEGTNQKKSLSRSSYLSSFQDPGPVLHRHSEAYQRSAVPVDRRTKELFIRDRLLMHQELQAKETKNTAEEKQDIKPPERTPSLDYNKYRNGNPLAIPTPIVPRHGILKKYAGTYELEKYRKKAMIIFNHQDFWGGTESTRKGTLRDEEALKTTFEMFGFHVESHLDLPKKELLDKLKSFCMKDFTQYGCVCAAILTHGSKFGYLRAYDTRYSEHELIECFNVLRNPSLFGKPIIILIQACRGDMPAIACLPDTSKLEDDIVMDNDPFDDHYNLPMESNMLIFHSSYIGRASARDPLNGSWFIQTLCKQIRRLADTTHFEGICMAVRSEIALEKEHKMMIDNKLALAKQMPVMTSTLIRPLYLRKYGGSDDTGEDEAR